MKWFKKLLIVGGVVLLLVYGYVYYFHTFSRTIVKAELIRMEGTQLTFRSWNETEYEAKAPAILLPLLEENQRYIVVIYRNALRPSFLKKIERSLN